MKQITLTQGQFALVDDCDYERLSQHKWYAKWDSHTRGFYAARNSRGTDGKRITIKMHREILSLEAKDECQADHISLNTLDNQRENLKRATHSQNICNRRLFNGSTSGFKGVSWHLKTKKWMSYINIAKKRIHLGYHLSPEAAYAAYCAAATVHHGEFARTA